MLWICNLFHRWGKWSDPEETKTTVHVAHAGGFRRVELSWVQKRVCQRCNQLQARSRFS